jgi:hypothetical protein
MMAIPRLHPIIRGEANPDDPERTQPEDRGSESSGKAADQTAEALKRATQAAHERARVLKERSNIAQRKLAR